MKSVEITDNTGNYKISSYDDDNEYEYIISCTKHGSCTFRATLGNITYEINAGFELPYTGAYNSIVCTEDAYLDGKFHFETGPKDSDGNSYFYLIMQCQNYVAGSVKASAGRYGDSGWKPKKIKGLEFGDVEVKYISGSRCYVSKVTVTKEFQSPYNSNNRYTIGFSVKSSNMDLGTHSMQIYDSREIEKDSRLYWFYDSEVDVADDGLVNLTVSYLNSLDKAACRVLERNSVNNERVTGYFAVRKDTGYYAVNVGDGAVLSTDKFEIGKIGRDNYPNSDFAYYVRFLKFGTSKFTTWYMGKEYSINLTASLPPVGLYSNEERTADSYLDGEFHFTDGPKDSSGNSYFYLIADDYGYEVDQVKGYICEHNEENRAASMDGISVGEAYRLDEDYITCRITVSEQYRETSSQSGYYIGLKYGNTNEYNADWIHIYDSMEYPKDRQLYWFDRWSVNINEQGIVTPDEKRNINELAVRKIMLERLKNSNYGYFAVKDGDNYRAVKNVNSLDNSDIMFADIGNSDNGNSSDSNEYLYGLKCMKIGEYKGQFSYSENGNEYRLSMVAVLPESGAYATSERNAESFLNDEFHFADAAEKSPDGSTAYFYVITRDYDVDININKTKVVVSDSYNGEDGVKGISAGKVEKFTAADGKSYFRCKIAVTSDYKQKEYGRIFISFEEDRRHDVISIRIGDSAEYPQKQQLYSFRYWSVDIGEDGLLTMSSDNDYDDMETLDDIAERVYTSSEKKDNMYECCFAVKKGDSYYAVNNLEALNSDNISIEKDEENAYRYYIRWTEFGIYTLKAEYEGSEYMFNLSVDLPEIAFYNEPVRDAENYLDGELHYIDAADTNESGSEAYFYLIASAYGYDINDISVAIRERNDDYDWVEKNVPGISISEPRYLDDSHKYCVWTIIVSKDYKGDRSNSAMRDDFGYNNRKPNNYFSFLISYKDEDGYSDSESIHASVYDSMEIADDQILYWFDKDYADTDDSKKIISKGYYYYAEKALFPSETVDAALYKNGKREGWFAVKTDEGEYYAVDNVEVTDNANIKLNYDGNRYTVKWSDFGDYRFTAVYEDKEYKQNLFLHVPDTGFFSSEDVSEKTYLDGEFHFITSDNKSADGKEAYFYLIGGEGYKYYYPAFIDDNDKPVQSDGICFELLPGSTYQKQVWKVTVTSDYRTGYYSARQIGWFSESGYLRKTEEINIYDSTEVPEEEQLYWFSDYEVRIRQDADGRLESEDENCTLDECANRILRTSHNNEAGYFAIKKGENEYYAVDSVKAEGFTVGKNKTTGLYIVNRLGIGEYYCSAVDSTDGREYRMKVIFKLPDSGFYSSINEQSSDTFLGSFDYNTSLVKAFYYICPEEDFDSIGTDNINAEILKADSENDETVDGLRIGEKGSIDKGGNTYYYWKIEVADSYSFNREIRLNFSFRENTAQSEPIKVLGPVECGDVDTNGTVDFVDALWLKRHVAKWNGYSDIYMKSADVNNDGKADEADVMILERYLAGWEEYRNLPYKAE